MRIAPIATLASPETVLRWYRELVARKYSAPSHKRHAPPKRNSIEEHVIRMARENSSWGYTRIRGALRNIGLDVGRSTIARVLKASGLEPGVDAGLPCCSGPEGLSELQTPARCAKRPRTPSGTLSADKYVRQPTTGFTIGHESLPPRASQRRGEGAL